MPHPKKAAARTGGRCAGWVPRPCQQLERTGWVRRVGAGVTRRTHPVLDKLLAGSSRTQPHHAMLLGSLLARASTDVEQRCCQQGYGGWKPYEQGSEQGTEQGTAVSLFTTLLEVPTLLTSLLASNVVLLTVLACFSMVNNAARNLAKRAPRY